jgi:hypothetical protein
LLGLPNAHGLPRYGRGGLLSFLDEKKQKSSQQKGFLPHMAFALQIR